MKQYLLVLPLLLNVYSSYGASRQSRNDLVFTASNAFVHAIQTANLTKIQNKLANRNFSATQTLLRLYKLPTTPLDLVAEEIAFARRIEKDTLEKLKELEQLPDASTTANALTYEYQQIQKQEVQKKLAALTRLCGQNFIVTI